MIYPVWIRLKSWIKTAELQRVKSPSKMEHSTKANGLMGSETVRASKSGQMVQDMTGPGRMIRLTAKENLYMLTEIFTKDGGSRVSKMETVLDNTKTNLYILGILLMAKKQVELKSFTEMVAYLKVHSKVV